MDPTTSPTGTDSWLVCGHCSAMDSSCGWCGGTGKLGKRLLEERDGARDRAELNGQCIMEMRENLKSVGIQGPFAADLAREAATEISKLRARVAILEMAAAVAPREVANYTTEVAVLSADAGRAAPAVGECGYRWLTSPSMPADCRLPNGHAGPHTDWFGVQTVRADAG